MAGSIAFLAFGGDSVIELISGIAVLRFLQSSIEGGISEAESERTERITSLLLFMLIPVIGVGSVYSYFVGIRAEGSQLGIAISLGALIVMPYLWNRKRTIGRETKTLALTLDAVESVTCIFMAVALLGSLLAEYFLGLWWADYAATAVNPRVRGKGGRRVTARIARPNGKRRPVPLSLAPQLVVFSHHRPRVRRLTPCAPRRAGAP